MYVPPPTEAQFGRSAALSIGMRVADKKQLQEQASKPAPVASRTAASDWQEMFTETGEKYYWNEKTQQSEWELPPAELAKLIKTETKKAQDTKRCTSPGCTNVQLAGKQCMRPPLSSLRSARSVAYLL
jgi:hypothetical protein